MEVGKEVFDRITEKKNIITPFYYPISPNSQIWATEESV